MEDTNLEGETVQVKKQTNKSLVLETQDGTEIAVLPVTLEYLQDGSRLLGLDITPNKV